MEGLPWRSVPKTPFFNVKESDFGLAAPWFLFHYFPYVNSLFVSPLLYYGFSNFSNEIRNSLIFRFYYPTPAFKASVEVLSRASRSFSFPEVQLTYGVCYSAVH